MKRASTIYLYTSTDMSKKRSTYYFLPEEPDPQRLFIASYTPFIFTRGYTPIIFIASSGYIHSKLYSIYIHRKIYSNNIHSK
jgi:hypothetical protein